jgi:hypothetical protein
MLRPHPDGAADLDKLNDLNAPFAAFVLRDKGLVPMQALSQPLLRKASRFPGGHQFSQ